MSIIHGKQWKEKLLQEPLNSWGSSDVLRPGCEQKHVSPHTGPVLRMAIKTILAARMPVAG